MLRALAAVGAACLVFIAVGLPSGVLGMVDQGYCFDHPERPSTTSFHEETLGLFPPGPVCRFTLEDGSVVVRGPGWWPATSAALAIAAGIIVLRAWPSPKPPLDPPSS
jgi:hypothetical protein